MSQAGSEKCFIVKSETLFLHIDRAPDTGLAMLFCHFVPKCRPVCVALADTRDWMLTYHLLGDASVPHRIIMLGEFWSEWLAANSAKYPLHSFLVYAHEAPEHAISPNTVVISAQRFPFASLFVGFALGRLEPGKDTNCLSAFYKLHRDALDCLDAGISGWDECARSEKLCTFFVGMRGFARDGAPGLHRQFRLLFRGELGIQDVYARGRALLSRVFEMVDEQLHLCAKYTLLSDATPAAISSTQVFIDPLHAGLLHAYPACKITLSFALHFDVKCGAAWPTVIWTLRSHSPDIHVGKIARKVGGQGVSVFAEIRYPLGFGMPLQFDPGASFRALCFKNETPASYQHSY